MPPGHHSGHRTGWLYVVGIGPGGPLDRTRRAEAAIAASQVVIGYKPYLELIRDLTAGKEVLATGMTQEVERCRTALQRAASGQEVTLVSSGDPGIYGMAGLVLELQTVEPVPVPIGETLFFLFHCLDRRHIFFYNRVLIHDLLPEIFRK